MNLKAIDYVKSECAQLFSDSKKIEVLAPLKNSVLLVTGGTGFMGSWIAEAVSFLNETKKINCQIILVARDFEKFRKKSPHLAENKNISLVKGDVRSALDLTTECNWIVHAAAAPDHHTSLSYPVETMTTIATGTELILRHASRCSQLKMLMNLSSGWVYGEQPLSMDRVSESYTGGLNLNSIGSIYPEAKRYSEVLCAGFRHQYKLPITNVRPFAFLGPYQRLSSPWAVNNFICDALSGNVIRILGNGDTVRSYMYATDMTFWLLRILVGASSGSSYNLGSTEAVKISDLASMISSMVEKQTEISFSSMSDKKSRLVPDVSAVERDFGLQQSIGLRESLLKTIAWYKVSQEV